MTANVHIQQILLKRGNSAQISSYTGPIGEPIYNTQTKTIHLQDGLTAGGFALATNDQLQSISETVANIFLSGGSYNNSNVASYLPTYTGNIAANIVKNGQKWTFGTDGTLQFPDSSYQSTAYQGPAGQTSFATTTYVDTKISLLANAPAILDTLGQIAANLQADENSIGTILGSITAANAKITTLQTQVYTNANVAAYLPVYGGNVSVDSIKFGNLSYRTVTPPATLYGKFDDRIGDVAYDGSYIYYCVNPVTSSQITTNNIGAYNGGLQLSADIPSGQWTAVRTAANIFVENSSGSLIGFINYNSDNGVGHFLFDQTSRFDQVAGATFWYVPSDSYRWVKTPWNALTSSSLLANITVGNVVPQANVTQSLGSSTQQWKSLYVGSDTIYINNHPLSVSEGQLKLNGAPIASANTGNLAFVDNAMYNLGGVIVENADLSHGATSAVIIPSNGSSDSLQLNNYYGQVEITSGTDSGHTKSWEFGTNGQITTPQGGALGDTYGDGNGIGLSAGSGEDDYAVINSHTGSQYVETNETAVYIGTNWPTTNTTWTFDKTGGLTLPLVNGGDTFIGTAFNTNPPGHTVTLKHNGGVDNGSGGQIKFDYGNAKISVIKDAGTVRDWTFDTTGNVTFPDGSVQTTAWEEVHAQSSAPSRGLWYNTDDGRFYVKYNDIWVDASPTVAPAPSYYLGNLSITDDVVDFTYGNLTIDSTGNLLVNGNLVTGSGGVGTVDHLTIRNSNDILLDGGSAVWNGSLDGASVFAGFQSPDSVHPSLFTFSATNSQTMSVQLDGALVVGDTLPPNYGGVSATTPGWIVASGGANLGGSINTLGVLSFSGTDLGEPASNGNRINLWPGDNRYAIGMNASTSWLSSASDVKLYGGSNNWTFAANGSLTAPGVINLSAGINWTGGSTVFEDTVIAVQGAVGVVITSPGSTQITAGSLQWTFDNTGNLTLPNSANILYANGQNILSGISGSLNTGDIIFNGSDITGSGSNVTITADTTDWVFNSDGNLTLPHGGTINDTNGPIELTPSGGSDANQKLKVYPTFAEGNHIHLTSGDLGVTDIFLGSDTQYIRTRTDGGMTIGTAVSVPDNANSGFQWTFGVDGSTTFPDQQAVSISGNLTVGNLVVNGTSTTINTASYTVDDNIIQIANGNPADTLDIGFVGHRTVGGTLQHTGLVRNASLNLWELFSNVTTQPGATVDFTNAIYDDLKLDKLYADTIHLSGTPPSTAQGASGDLAGDIHVDSNYLYYCTQDWTTSTWNIGPTLFDASNSNWLDFAHGSFPQPQPGWTITVVSPSTIPYTFHVDHVTDDAGAYRVWTVEQNITVYAAWGNFTMTNPNPSAIWKTIPISTFGYGGYSNTNVAAYLSSNTVTAANLIVTGSAPISSIGSAGDTAGMIRVDNNYVYYCTSTYTPSTYTVGWLGAVSNTIFLAKGSYPDPQVGWTINQSTYTFTIATIQTYGGDSSQWQITYVGTPYGSPAGGTATVTNPNPPVIWKTIPLTTFGNASYGNANVATYLTTGVSGNIKTSANVVASNFLYANGVNIISTIPTYSNSNVASYLTTATFATTGNITAGNIIANQYGNSVGTTATYSGNVTANYLIGNISTSSNISTTGNVIASNVIISNTFTVANIVTTGTYGNITGANVISANTLVVGGVNLTRATNGYNNWKGNTYANVDNISCSVFSNGMPALSSVSGTLNYFWSATSVMAGHTIIGNTNTGGSATTTPQSFGLPWTLTSGGDTVTAVIQDQGLSRVYNVTYMQTVGVGNCAIIVERLM